MTYDELPTTKYATFEMWRNLGYGIIKGSKAFWADGISYFTEHQVNPFATRATTEKPKFEVKSTEEVIASYKKEKDDYPF